MGPRRTIWAPTLRFLPTLLLNPTWQHCSRFWFVNIQNVTSVLFQCLRTANGDETVSARVPKAFTSRAALHESAGMQNENIMTRIIQNLGCRMLSMSLLLLLHLLLLLLLPFFLLFLWLLFLPFWVVILKRCQLYIKKTRH